MRVGWKMLARELCDHLQEGEEKLSLLQDIDKATLSPDMSLDDVIQNAIHRLKNLLRVLNVSFYAVADARLQLLVSTSVNAESAISLPPLPDTRPGVTHLLTNDSIPTGMECESVLFAPIFTKKESPMGILAVESDHPSQVGHLDNEPLKELVSAVSRQLSIAIEFKERSRTEAIRWEILSEILDQDLKPNVGFGIIAKHLPRLLPPFKSLLVSPEPKIQILFHSREQDYLTVVATTGEERINTRVLKGRSVCGKLIDSSFDTVNIDTNSNPFYRAYLGSEMKSEIALKLRISDSVTAVLNLETSKTQAFQELHLDALRSAGQHLRPVLAGLYFRQTEP